MLRVVKYTDHQYIMCETEAFDRAYKITRALRRSYGGHWTILRMHPENLAELVYDTVSGVQKERGPYEAPVAAVEPKPAAISKFWDRF